MVPALGSASSCSQSPGVCTPPSRVPFRFGRVLPPLGHAAEAAPAPGAARSARTRAGRLLERAHVRPARQPRHLCGHLPRFDWQSGHRGHGRTRDGSSLAARGDHCRPRLEIPWLCCIGGSGRRRPVYTQHQPGQRSRGRLETQAQMLAGPPAEIYTEHKHIGRLTVTPKRKICWCLTIESARLQGHSHWTGQGKEASCAHHSRTP